MQDSQRNLMRLENQQKDMLHFGNYFLRGLLTVNDGKEKKPLYIAEYHTSGEPRSIAIYGVTTEKLADGTVYYDKKYTVKKTQHTKYDTSTLLGRLAQGDTKPETVKAKEYDLPIFIETIEQGVDTFTHKEGDGFWEHTRGRFDPEDGYVMGEKTGVFICLDSFKWQDAKYRFTDVMEALRDKY